MNRLVPTLLTAITIVVLAGCGGSSNVAASSGSTGSIGLSYVNPTLSGDTFALVKDSASTASILILDLVGPDSSDSTFPACGVTFGFTLDTTKATWGSIANGTLFATSTAAGNTLIQRWLDTATGSQLQGIVAYRGLATAVSDIGYASGKVIAKLTLTPVANASSGTVTLADGGQGTYIDNTGSTTSFTVAVGTLSLTE
jgi:hypothetical protein